MLCLHFSYNVSQLIFTISNIVFQQYGDIRTLYTATKHRGFVMISYFDIRAARGAMRGLQNKPLRRRKLDIHFSIPKVYYVMVHFQMLSPFTIKYLAVCHVDFVGESIR